VNRNRIGLIRDLLAACEYGVNMSEACRRANLTWSTASPLLDRLKALGLLTETKGQGKSREMTTTPRGKEYVRLVYDLRVIFDEDEDNFSSTLK
jgi:predicted transcriptional regulator